MRTRKRYAPMVALLLGASAAMVSGCAATYSGYAMIPLDPSTVLPTTSTNDEGLRTNWERTIGRCSLVRRNMLREAETIQRNDRAIGSVFAGLAAGFAAATTIYSASTDQPDRLVTTILGAGAGLSTVPTFAYFGADTREQEVRTRITEIDRLRGLAVQSSIDLAAHAAAVSAAEDALGDALKDVTDATAARDAGETARSTADTALGAAHTELNAAQAAATPPRGTPAQRGAAATALALAQTALADRQRASHERSEAMCTLRANLQAATTRRQERSTALATAEARLHQSEQDLETHLQRMVVACQ